jgi:hypothetical protein
MKVRSICVIVLSAAAFVRAADVPPQVVPSGGPVAAAGDQQITDGRDAGENIRRQYLEKPVTPTYALIYIPGQEASADAKLGKVRPASLIPTDSKTPLPQSSWNDGSAESKKTYLAWTASLELAAKVATKTHEAYVVYFCSETMAALVGEGDEAWNAYKKLHAGTVPPPSLFDRQGAVRAIQDAQIHLLVKVSNTPENRASFQKFEASEGSIIVVGSDGNCLARFGEQTSEKAFIDYLRKDLVRQMEPATAKPAPDQKKPGAKE